LEVFSAKSFAVLRLSVLEGLVAHHGFLPVTALCIFAVNFGEVLNVRVVVAKGIVATHFLRPSEDF
jgi:hypothetical protein